MPCVKKHVSQVERGVGIVKQMTNLQLVVADKLAVFLHKGGAIAKAKNKTHALYYDVCSTFESQPALCSQRKKSSASFHGLSYGLTLIQSLLIFLEQSKWKPVRTFI